MQNPNSPENENKDSATALRADAAEEEECAKPTSTANQGVARRMRIVAARAGARRLGRESERAVACSEERGHHALGDAEAAREEDQDGARDRGEREGVRGERERDRTARNERVRDEPEAGAFEAPAGGGEQGG